MIFMKGEFCNSKYIKRHLESTILKYLPAPEIIAVVGPRQSGKTTMIRHLLKGLPDATSVSFDDQRILGMFERNVDDSCRDDQRLGRVLAIRGLSARGT